jgi:integrating conjugative element protein (TIGR03752 family)
MQLTTNPAIKALLACCLVVPLFLYVNNNSTDKVETDKPKKSTGSSLPNQTSSEEIAALSGYLKTIEDKVSKLESHQPQGQNVEPEKIQAIVNDALVKAGVPPSGELTKQIETLVKNSAADIKNDLMSESAVSPNNIGDVNEELTPFDSTFEIGGSDKNAGKSVSTQSNGSKTEWVYPLGVEPDKKGVLPSFDSLAQAGQKGGAKAVNSVKASKAALEESLAPKPYATIHADSSIHDSTALTALIGRIERKGKSHEPFRFQIMVSADTLLANGLEIPQVANAIVSGVATGDFAFECVRGKVLSFSFNFADGRIYNQRGTFEKPLAELGDSWGNPCIKGVLVSDIEEFVATQGAVAGLASVANSIEKQQSTITNGAAGSTISMTGDTSKAAGGAFLSGGLNKTGEIMAERYESYYEAVYVPPGQKVTLLMIEPVNIDYNPNNRKVAYDQKSTRANSLD